MEEEGERGLGGGGAHLVAGLERARAAPCPSNALAARKRTLAPGPRTASRLSRQHSGAQRSSAERSSRGPSTWTLSSSSSACRPLPTARTPRRYGRPRPPPPARRRSRPPSPPALPALPAPRTSVRLRSPSLCEVLRAPFELVA
eukprot:723435-Rhodomonas_salina.1